MITLGIETTAHTFGVGIVTDKGEFLANVKDMITSEHGGIIPAQAGEHHFNIWETVLNQALDRAKITLSDVDLISFSQGPGIGNCLRVGAFVARALALTYKKPIIGVNHCIAHLSIGKVRTKTKDPVLLYTSGANMQVIAYEGKKYRIFGETLDMGVGNFIDSVAREIGLGFPGGPKLEKLALQGKNLIRLPYSIKGMDLSFGGLFTNVCQKIKSKKYTNEDLAFSIQETVFAMLVEVAERAMAHTGKNELLLGGGVACNTRLQKMCEIMCKERGAYVFVPEREYLVDNGAMIAWQGSIQYNKRRKQNISRTQIQPYWRTDEVKVDWI